MVIATDNLQQARTPMRPFIVHHSSFYVPAHHRKNSTGSHISRAVQSRSSPISWPLTFLKYRPNRVSMPKTVKDGFVGPPQQSIEAE